jgi:uncharacterized protein YjbI with pentapeptide repeats
MKLTQVELDEVLRDHEEWRSNSSVNPHVDLGRAYLCEANLGGLNLENADLRGADLSGANLYKAELARAYLQGVDLRGANLREAKLMDADLFQSKLSGADLSRADLSWATLDHADLSNSTLSEAVLRNISLISADLSSSNLSQADLRESRLIGASLHSADLTGVNLTSADLTGADLTSAYLRQAILKGMTFNPATITDPSKMLFAKGLSEIRIEIVDPVVKMRKALAEAGFRNEQKALSSALKKHQLVDAPLRERLFQDYLIGGKLTDYGANPWASLEWLGIGIFVFFWPYLLAILKGNEKAGIWRERPESRLLKLPDEKDHELLVLDKKWLHSVTGVVAIVGIPAYFSLLSAFHFGWRQLNIGNWLSRVQLREYVLKATGWVRMISGLQSLLSLYLVVLFLLSYFGNPFA